MKEYMGFKGFKEIKDNLIVPMELSEMFNIDENEVIDLDSLPLYIYIEDPKMTEKFLYSITDNNVSIDDPVCERAYYTYYGIGDPGVYSLEIDMNVTNEYGEDYTNEYYYKNVNNIIYNLVYELYEYIDAQNTIMRYFNKLDKMANLDEVKK